MLFCISSTSESCTLTKRFKNGPKVRTISHKYTAVNNTHFYLNADFIGGVRQAKARRSQRGSLASKSSREGEYANISKRYANECNDLAFLDRVVPLSVDHFNQNGNIKNISHIDAEGNVDTENDENAQKIIRSTAEKTDIELGARDAKIGEKRDSTVIKEKPEAENVDNRFYLFRFPTHKRIWHQVLWIIIWPMELLFFLTIPNCEQKRFKNLFPFTFLMCIVWIGSLSYLVAWMITIVGQYSIVVNACMLNNIGYLIISHNR